VLNTDKVIRHDEVEIPNLTWLFVVGRAQTSGSASSKFPGASGDEQPKTNAENADAEVTGHQHRKTNPDAIIGESKTGTHRRDRECDRVDRLCVRLPGGLAGGGSGRADFLKTGLRLTKKFFTSASPAGTLMRCGLATGIIYERRPSLASTRFRRLFWPCIQLLGTRRFLHGGFCPSRVRSRVGDACFAIAEIRVFY